ncbi:MAG TPA: hypothetical protein VMV07_03990 [Streptosporangiaceae bacterium]|nr:hypothetical protein [Streptosporangiaceae bacterium]
MFWSSRASGLPRRLLIVAAAALIPVLAGCGAGSNAPILNWHYPTEGAGVTTAQHMAIRNVFVLGAPPPAALQAGQSASLFFALVNDGSPDRLISIQAPGTATAVTIPGGSIRLASSQVVLLTGPRPQAVLTGLTRTLTSGSAITLVLNFQNGGSVRLRVPVVAMTGAYGTFSPAPTPTPTLSPGKHHRRVSPSPSASGLTTSPATTPSPSSTSTP